MTSTATICDIIITYITEPFGDYPYQVEVNHHLELPDGSRDGFETTRVCLSVDCFNEDGSMNQDEIYKSVRAKIGETAEL